LSIKFGTDGWRALMTEEFTESNVRICAQAVSNYLLEQGSHQNGLIIGYDTREYSEVFAKAVAEVAASNEIPVVFCEGPTPTPVVSYNLTARDCAGGVIITASHNPKEWNGFKFRPGYGGSASPDIVAQIETHIEKLNNMISPNIMDFYHAQTIGIIEKIDASEPYMNHIASLVDLDGIRKAGLNVIVDSMHGAGCGYINELLRNGSTKIIEIRGDPNPSFPGMLQPEPIDQNLSELKTTILENNGDVGLALDGDADRLGLVEDNGVYVSTLHTFALICKHLLENLGLKGTLVRSITMTNMINQLGTIHGVSVVDTPVGFKHLGPIMMEEEALAAGEESGGYAFRGHIPERDGILSALFILDMMVTTGQNPSELLADLVHTVGPHYYKRIDIEFDSADTERISNILNDFQPQNISGLDVKKIDTRDGYKFMLEDQSWCLLRFSGTEPLLRIYAEANSDELVDSLLKSCQELVSL